MQWSSANWEKTATNSALPKFVGSVEKLADKTVLPQRAVRLELSGEYPGIGRVTLWPNFYRSIKKKKIERAQPFAHPRKPELSILSTASAQIYFARDRQSTAGLRRMVALMYRVISAVGGRSGVALPWNAEMPSGVACGWWTRGSVFLASAAHQRWSQGADGRRQSGLPAN